MGHPTEVFIGIDVAKVRNAIEVADGERGGDVRFIGEVDASPDANETVRRRTGEPSAPTLAKYSDSVARLGGYMARSHDQPPGNIVMWRGWRRLMDISIGYRLAVQSCG